MKMPITPVSLSQIVPLYQKLYDLGWRACSESSMDTTPYPTPVVAAEAHMGYQDITHVVLYNHMIYPRTIWTCGPKRKLSDILASNSMWNATLVNSPAHMIAYVKRLNVHLGASPHANPNIPHA